MTGTTDTTPSGVDATRAALLRLALAKPGAHLDQPWPDDTVVKVGERIFAYFGPDGRPTVGLKCGRDRTEADTWVQEHPDAVSASRYVGRYGWNAFRVGKLPFDDLARALSASYDQVAARVPRSRR